ncbi:phosphatidylinositol mannoside acyltransferase, partial [Asanoa siamensis]|uniref:phosphatidylinositol mannoside acyltransferase n=1 Tax=Asanoa siamensis TaxID=926357 RepID=UPI001944311D
MNPVDLGYAAGWKLVRGLPEPVAHRLFEGAADYAHRKNGRGTRRLRSNLRRVVGPEMPDAELDELTRAGLRSYARYWKEAFRLPSRTHQQHLDDFRVANWHLLAKMQEENPGVIMALSHSGNWDIAGAWVTAMGWKLTTVAERLKPEAVFERFVEYRRSIGMEILPLTGGERPPFDILVERLEAGAIVPLLCERDLSRRGVEVEFFGGRTR